MHIIMADIPVYLVAGFLDAGKTNFINGILEDGFARQDRTLLLCCEEGEEEYDPHLFKVKNVFIEYIEKADLNAAHLTELVQKYKCGRVVVEYNGTWLLQDFCADMI